MRYRKYYLAIVFFLAGIVTMNPANGQMRQPLKNYQPVLNLEELMGVQSPVFIREQNEDYYVSMDEDTIPLEPEDLIAEELMDWDTVRVFYEYVPDVSFEEAGRRLALLQQNTTMPLNYNATVKGFIDFFVIRDREYTKMVMRRKNLYFPLFEKYLKKYNLPDELKYLAIVESGLNTRAISRAGAGGLWQFMPATGRMYKLHQDWFIDERFDPEKATEAACKYLKELYGMFNDWELALGSYNAGPGNVRKAIRKSGYKNSFWEIYNHLPRETRSYVPQFVAVAYAFNYAEEHNFFIDDHEYQIVADTIFIDGYVHLPTMANLLDVCIEDIEKLNPHLKNKAVPAHAKQMPLRIPYDRSEFYAFNRLAILDSASKVGQSQIEAVARTAPTTSTSGREKIVYRVKSGDNLGAIAQRYGVKVADLRSWNRLNSNMIQVGQRLDIFVRNSVAAAHNSAATTKPPISNQKIHVVQPGDTLWNISRKYNGLSIEKIKELNNLKDNNIKPGQKLVVG
jgi:membrane-bound lytic murein transglycosylase D